MREGDEEPNANMVTHIYTLRICLQRETHQNQKNSPHIDQF